MGVLLFGMGVLLYILPVVLLCILCSDCWYPCIAVIASATLDGLNHCWIGSGAIPILLSRLSLMSSITYDEVHLPLI
jgi:hypothetical protein